MTEAMGHARQVRLPQVFDLVVDTEIQVLIGRLAERQRISPAEAASRLLEIGVQAELFRQRWLAGMHALTPRTREAAMLLLEGKTYGEVATAMGISYWTANEYCREAARALGQPGRAGVWQRYGFLLVVFARNDLIGPDD